MLERLKGYVQNPVFLFILWMGVGLSLIHIFRRILLLSVLQESL